ncbi:MAG: DUF5666 domain-containing protein [Myxococcales bacterium]
MTKKIRGILGIVLVALWATFVVGCGSSDAGGGGGGETAAASEGPIAGFGSVIMNGVRWNTDDASFEVDGATGSQDDLSIGMFVRIEGQRSKDRSAKADRVVFKSRLRGPIRNIEILGPATLELTVFGLDVLVSRAGTRFKDTDLDSLVVGEIVEASGFVNANGGLEASHLRSRGDAIVGMSEVKVSGDVMDLAGGSFLIGTTEVLFDASTELDDLGAMTLEEGMAVRVEGVLLANDAIDAEEIEGLRRRGEDDDFDEIEFQGIVSEYVSLSDFQVADRRVDASEARLIPNDAGLLRDGVRIEVEGRYDADGVLIAEKLKFRSNRVRIEAEIASDADVDAVLGELYLLGIPIQVDSGTRIEDKRDDLDGFGLADLQAGDFVELRGIAGSDGTVTATRLEREDSDDLRLRGPVDMIDVVAQNFTILGVLIQTGSGTKFEVDDDETLTSEAFFERIQVGSVVKAKDRVDGDETIFDPASEVELEEPELEDDDEDGEDDDEDEDDEDDLT